MRYGSHALWLRFMHAAVQCRSVIWHADSPVVGKAHLVAPVLGINDPIIIQVKEVGVAVPVICLAPPVRLLVVDQLPRVLCHKLIPLDVLLHM